MQFDTDPLPPPGPERPRRLRRSEALRRAVRETRLTPSNLVLPLFVAEGENTHEPILSMPGCARLGLAPLARAAKEALDLGIPAVALFPVIASEQKDPRASASARPDGLLQRALQHLRAEVPGLLLVSDVALDPYSSDGHDGLLVDGEIRNDETLPLLARMAVSQAVAGADLVAPSDMMDGRVRVLRHALDQAGFTQTGIVSYTAKYASAFYGPFREALDSAPRSGDKQTYQMDPANRREAAREARLDLEEGADILLVKPALAYLDIISDLRALADVPIAAYHVSGEYSMVKAAGKLGWLDEARAMRECLLAIRRAGADLIFTYAAVEVARTLS